MLDVKSRIVAAEMKFIGKSLGYNWIDYKTDTEVLDELNNTSVIEKINVCKSNWTNHVSRMPCNRFP